MSVQTMAAVWKGSQHGGSALLMMLAIADFSDDRGVAYPAVSTLAEKTRMKPRNAHYLLRALHASGELVIKIAAGPRGTNLYRIALDRLQGVQPVAGVQPGAGVHRSARGGALECANPLHPSAPEPSLNHHEPANPVADATDADASKVLSAKERVWLLGPAVLGDKGRTLLGKLAKQHGDEIVAAVLAAAHAQMPIQEPRAWVVAACDAAAKRKPQAAPTGDAKPKWALDAGFQNRFEAENDGCFSHNASAFSNGKRKESK